MSRRRKKKDSPIKTVFLIIMAAILALSLFRIHDSYGMLKLLLAIIGFAFGLSLFLQEYLLYRFENEE